MSTSWAKNLTKDFQTRRGNKFGAKRQTIAGETYRSGLEAEVHAILKLMERAGEIKNIKREEIVEIFPGQTHKIDFVFFEEKRQTFIFCEAKGHECPTWREKLKAYRAFSTFPLQIWDKKKGRVGCSKEYPPGRYRVILKQEG